jgi:hypothetical protein
VFGSSGGFSANLNLSTLNGSNGFVINGIDAYDRSGRSVSSAEDVNSDGFDDLLIGASAADTNSQYNAGSSYVVFGSSGGFSANFNLSTLNGSNGFQINASMSITTQVISVSSAGDVNGDGFDDILIGGFGCRSTVNISWLKLCCVWLIRRIQCQPQPKHSQRQQCFKINGIDQLDNSGNSVSSAGDVNGDGFDDILIGALGATPNDQKGAGESYVVFAKVGGFSRSSISLLSTAAMAL